MNLGHYIIKNMNKYKAELTKIKNSINLTPEQYSIMVQLQHIINDIGKFNSNKIIEVSSRKGDGKTTLLNSLIYFEGVSHKFKINNNIAISDDLCIVDDIHKLNKEHIAELHNKYKLLIFTRNSNYQFDFRIDKNLKLKNKEKLKYLDIKNSQSYFFLRNLEPYSFSTLKMFCENINRDIYKTNEINTKVLHLFYQKKIEEMYGNEWNNIKQLIVDSANTYPVVNLEKINNDKLEQYLNNEWIIKRDNKYYFEYDEILIEILLREDAKKGIYKNGTSLPEYCEKYWESKLFQFSLISYLEIIGRLQLISGHTVFLSVVLLTKSTNELGNMYVYDLNSLYDIYLFFNNQNLYKKYNYYELLKKPHLITRSFYLTEDEMLSVVEKWSNFQIAIYFSFLFLLEVEDHRLFPYIEWRDFALELNEIVESSNFNGIEKYFLIYLTRLIMQTEDINLEEYIGLDNLLKIGHDLLGVDLSKPQEILGYLEYYKKEIGDDVMCTIIDCVFYYFNKSSLLEETSLWLHYLDKKNIKINNNDNQYLKYFNLLLYSLLLKYSDSKEQITKWIKNNFENLYKMQYLGIPGNIEPINYELFLPLYFMRNALLMQKEIKIFDEKEYSKKNIKKREVDKYIPTYLLSKIRKDNFLLEDFSVIDK